MLRESRNKYTTVLSVRRGSQWSSISEDRKKYNAVLKKFDDYCKVRWNTIFERAKLNRRSQREGESTEQYIAELYELILWVWQVKEEMLRDRLVVSIRDLSLLGKLQTDPELTLERAKTAAEEHCRELQGNWFH